MSTNLKDSYKTGLIEGIAMGSVVSLVSTWDASIFVEYLLYLYRIITKGKFLTIQIWLDIFKPWVPGFPWDTFPLMKSGILHKITK